MYLDPSGVLGEAGTTVTGGYQQNHTTNANRTITSASIGPAAVVPLPAALPLAASAFAGLGAAGWLQRRRDRATLAAPA